MQHNSNKKKLIQDHLRWKDSQPIMEWLNLKFLENESYDFYMIIPS